MDEDQAYKLLVDKVEFSAHRRVYVDGGDALAQTDVLSLGSHDHQK